MKNTRLPAIVQIVLTALIGNLQHDFRLSVTYPKSLIIWPIPFAAPIPYPKPVSPPQCD